jgi:hypothetical protein
MAAHNRWWEIGEIVFGVPFLLGIGLNIALPLSIYPRHTSLPVSPSAHF